MGSRRGAPGRSRRGTSFLFSACVAQNYRRLLLFVWIFFDFFFRGVFQTIFSKTPPLRLSFAAHSRFSIHCGQIIRAAHVSFSLMSHESRNVAGSWICVELWVPIPVPTVDFFSHVFL